MAENFEAVISANIRDFQRAMREVDQEIRETAMGAEADIGADISDFMAEMSAVDSALSSLANNTTVDINADISDAIAEITAIDSALSSLPNNTEVDINADISDVVGDVATVRASLLSLAMTRIVIPIEARINNFQATIARLASNIRAFGELASNTFRGIGTSLSPALVPLIATLGGLIGQLGPVMGTLAGSTFALGSAFATAGIGAGAFAAVAVTHLKEVFNASSELKKLQDKLGEADTLKERNAVLKEMAAITKSLSAEQTKALQAMTKFKSVWSDITKDLEKPTLEFFTKSLTTLGFVLQTLKPMFASVTEAANNLIDSLGKTVKSESMMAFFDYLNNTAGPMMETVFKSIGNLLKGFFSMMTAFGPLSESTAAGFLKMSESFATWAAGLSESEKFKSFVDYVNVNMPKLKSIFSDAIMGIINLFAAFAPSSAGMMTSLQDMMARFREWSATLAENQQFQAFIDYIKTNGPQVAALIGNITTFLVNFGIALAPVGQSILEIINHFLAWSSAMLENHPWLGKIVAGLIVLGGALMAIIPNVIAVATLFELTLVTAFASWVAAQAVALAAWISTTAAMIGQWILLAAQSTLNAIKTGAAWLLATGASMATAISSMIVAVATFIAQWVLMAAQATLNAIKVAAAWVLTTGAAMATAIASMIAAAVTYIAQWVLMAVGATAQAVIMAAAWFIALGPIGWVAAAIIALVALVIANWDTVSAATSAAWTAISNAVSNAASAIMGYIQDTFPGLYAVIQSAMKSAQQIIESVWNFIKGTFQNTLSFLKALVKGDFEGMKDAAKNQMDLMKSTIQTIWNAIKEHFSTVLTTIMNLAKEKFSQIASAVKDKMDEVKSAIQDKFEQAKSAASEKLSALVTAVGTFFTSIVTTIQSKLTEAVSTVGQKVGEMPGKVTSFVGAMVTAGGNLIQGLIDGIIGMARSAVDAISNVVGSMINAATSLLKEHSPSRVFIGIGQYVSEGLAIGVTDKANMAVQSVARMATAMTNAFTPQIEMPSIDFGMNRIDATSEIDELKRQIKQELSVDMSVNHNGNGQAGTGFNPTITNYFTPAESTPSQSARKQKQMLQRVALDWRN